MTEFEVIIHGQVDCHVNVPVSAGSLEEAETLALLAVQNNEVQWYGADNEPFKVPINSFFIVDTVKVE